MIERMVLSWEGLGGSNMDERREHVNCGCAPGRSDRPGLWADPGEQRRLAPSVVRHTVTNTGPIGLPVMVEVEVDGVFFRERGVLGGAVPGS
jgi:hypothetical protein